MEKYAMHPNPLVRFLKKEPKDFTKADLIRYIVENGVEMVNFRYAAADGRLKALNFIINDLDYLDTILTYGERVDGSSLFPNFVQAGASDLYVVPRYRTAFLNPFSEIPTIDILCGFYDKDGQPFESAPDQALHRERCRKRGSPRSHRRHHRAERKALCRRISPSSHGGKRGRLLRARRYRRHMVAG
jgi:glutamine synthetase